MNRRCTGFTLIEVLVVLAVAGLILAMLAQGLRVGVRGTDVYRRAVQTQSDMVPVERALRHMIERIDPGIYPEPPLVRGTAQAVVFTTELPDPVTGGTLTADVRLAAEDGRLVLWWTRHTNGVPFGQPPAPQRVVLLEGVVRLEISYAARWAGTAWLADWMQPAMPGLIRLRVERGGGGRAWPPIIARPQREQAEE